MTESEDYTDYTDFKYKHWQAGWEFVKDVARFHKTTYSNCFYFNLRNL
jgi:hypothetical protein